ncbi:3-ketoacyl-CoA thiolase [Fructilactobacillus florum 8D]|uniref:acetyl-CoA C-acetyltransferase n=2 Tax=Fructilactobacillus florum TaxID=640331 RepID=W9EHI2_9LACO|nr:thiolase family protein [Fructilactobacillus florum]ETO40435.1 3-ketoacyl-CoA thiolase [Fructilactobacillus florum 8D]KRM91339.1 acetyl-CoA acetyltransferase [Fructilactobacillus florum DSM 22689 = JCM 16035]
MEKVVIVSARRTPIGKINGQLRDFSSVELGIITVKAILAETKLDPRHVDQVIFGNVVQAGGGQNVARQIELGAGIPNQSTAATINQVCGSGLKAIRLGQMAIQCGDCDVVIAGGTESMSNAPFLNRHVRGGHKFGGFTLEDSLESDGLNDYQTNQPMGQTAEQVAQRFQINRAAQDRFALSSQQKAAAANSAGIFSHEIVPITNPHHGQTQVIATDEAIRPETSLTKLQQLKPVFQTSGTVTAGNAAGLNDGAAAILLMSATKASQLGLEPLAILDDYAEAGCDPAIMGYAPTYAVQKLLAKTNETISDFDLVELNEAFASQSLAVCQALKLDLDRLNIYGGALALGHPLGASGTRIVITLINALKNTQKKRGLATLCIGGGMGMAMTLHRPD